MISFFKKIFSFFDNLMMKPLNLFLFLFLFLFFSLFFDESLFKVSSLYHRFNLLKVKEKNLKQEITNMNSALKDLKNPEYIDFLLKEKFNWSKKKELLFFFVDTKNKKK